ncbi:MAG: TIGR02206 family membrane protein [Planctomycetota bacterium]
MMLITVPIAVALLGFARRGEKQALLMARTLGVLGIGIWVTSGVFYSIPPQLKPEESLPIQACDLLALIAAVAMLRPVRLLRAVTYFGAFGLTLQAFLTPVIDTGPDTMKFYMFWLLHISIVFCAVFDVVVRGFRPTGRDLLVAVAWWAGYALIMIGVNYPTGWYYGYLGPKIPPNAEDTILKHLGPWPVRPLSMMALALILFTLLWLPWAIFRPSDSGFFGFIFFWRSAGPDRQDLSDKE